MLAKHVSETPKYRDIWFINKHYSKLKTKTKHNKSDTLRTIREGVVSVTSVCTVGPALIAMLSYRDCVFETIDCYNHKLRYQFSFSTSCVVYTGSL